MRRGSSRPVGWRFVSCTHTHPPATTPGPCNDLQRLATTVQRPSVRFLAGRNRGAWLPTRPPRWYPDGSRRPTSPDPGMQRLIPPPVLALIVLTLAGGGRSPGADPPKAVDFAHDVVPILKAHCAKCHTNGTYKGSLS